MPEAARSPAIRHRAAFRGSMPDTANPADYERSDAPPGLLAALGALIAGTIIALMIALAFLYPNSLRDRPKGPLQSLPPQPRLQVAPRSDLVRYEQAENERLHSYGWTDRASGQVHIPIETAMRQVAAQGWRGGE